MAGRTNMKDKKLEEAVDYAVKRCALLLLIGGTSTDNGNQAEGQDEGNDEWKELGDGTGK